MTANAMDYPVQGRVILEKWYQIRAMFLSIEMWVFIVLKINLIILRIDLTLT